MLSSNIEDSVSTGSAIFVVVDGSPVTKLIVIVEIQFTEGEVDDLVLYKYLPISLVEMDFPSQ